jgi:hypothetical protein
VLNCTDRLGGIGETRVVMTSTRHLLVTERCSNCGTSLQLECEGAPVYLGYRTHNAYICPHCRKQSHALTFGAIVAATASPAAG